jgi:hypothetical protein
VSDNLQLEMSTTSRTARLFINVNKARMCFAEIKIIVLVFLHVTSSLHSTGYFCNISWFALSIRFGVGKYLLIVSSMYLPTEELTPKSQICL